MIKYVDKHAYGYTYLFLWISHGFQYDGDGYVVLRTLWTDLSRGRIWEDDISLHRGYMGMVAREEWLECRHDASPMLDIPGSTPVWAP